jgi:FKBP-type peptidyl-prolyl cis-trans isomerase SlyD
MSATTISANTFVTLEYTLRDDDGDLIDASDLEDAGPLEYVHGYGMLVPGLEAALAGMREGEKKDVVVSADEGYGEYDDELVLEIDRSEFPNPAKVERGDELVAELPDGDEVAMEVIEVKRDTVVVDANHPLAGKTLHYSVRVRSLRDATADEIEKAAAEMEQAREEHVHGEGCAHDHDSDHDHGEGGHDHGPELVTLGKKPGKKLVN